MKSTIRLRHLLNTFPRGQMKKRSSIDPFTLKSSLVFCRTLEISRPHPDPEITGRPVSKILFSARRASVWSLSLVRFRIIIGNLDFRREMNPKFSPLESKKLTKTYTRRNSDGLHNHCTLILNNDKTHQKSSSSLRSRWVLRCAFRWVSLLYVFLLIIIFFLYFFSRSQ